MARGRASVEGRATAVWPTDAGQYAATCQTYSLIIASLTSGTSFTASTKSSNSSCSVASGFSSVKVVSSWRGSGFADVMVVIHLIHGRRSMSPIRPLRSSDSGGRRISPRLRSCGASAVPADGVYGFPRSLAHTIEPRAPIGKLGFTEGYPLLEIGEHMQERVSMHAAQYRTTPISWALMAARYPTSRPRL